MIFFATEERSEGRVCVAEFTVLGDFGMASLASVATVWKCAVMHLFGLGNSVCKCNVAVEISDRGAGLMVTTYCLARSSELCAFFFFFGVKGHGAFYI